MINLHFYLEKRKDTTGIAKNRECPVLVSLSYSSFRVKVYTGRKVHEQDWDRKQERLGLTSARAEVINTFLSQLEERIEIRFREIESGGIIPDPVQFQKTIKKMMKLESPSFTELLLRFIEDNNKKWSISTYKKMKTFYIQMKEYICKKDVIINPGMVNQVFADDLVRFYREKGLRDTSIKKNLDLLKWFMNWGLQNELIFNRDYENIRFIPVVTEVHNDIFLPWNDLMRFYSFSDLTKREEWCRDIFCFISFTGLRFSALDKLLKTNLTGRNINVGDNHTVLLNRFALGICLKYENKYYRKNTLFPVMSIITFNKHLKSAAFKAGMHNNVFTSPDTSSFEPMHKLISAKIAINTFYANLVKIGGVTDRTSVSRANSSKTRILSASGAFRLAEEKQIAETDLLFESIQNTVIQSQN